VLAFVGAGLAAVVAGLWQVYLHLTPPPPAAPPAMVIQVQATPAQTLPVAGPAPDTNALKGLEASQARAMEDYRKALDGISQQIEASDQPAGRPPHKTQ